MNPYSEAQTRSFGIENEDGARTIRGYAAVFNSPANLPWGKEVIDPRAFDGVDLSNVRLLVGHDKNRILGRAGKNVTLGVDELGLWFRADLPDTTDGEDTYKLIQAGIVDECSFEFWVDKEQYDETANTHTILKIRAVREITICGWGAYAATVVEAVPPAEEQPPEVEHIGPDLALLAESYLH